MKLKTGLYKQYEEEMAEKRNQDRLKQKYHIEEANIKVIEKSTPFKFFLRFLLQLISWIAKILLILLAAIGLLSIIYPESRAALYTIVQQIFVQIQNFL